jgi:CBS domain-containing protein
MSLNEVKALPREKWFEVKVLDICNKDYHTAYPDSDLVEILDIMYRRQQGRVPIVDRTRPKRMVGIVSKTDIIRSIEKQRLGA